MAVVVVVRGCCYAWDCMLRLRFKLDRPSVRLAHSYRFARKSAQRFSSALSTFPFLGLHPEQLSFLPSFVRFHLPLCSCCMLCSHDQINLLLHPSSVRSCVYWIRCCTSRGTLHLHLHLRLHPGPGPMRWGVITFIIHSSFAVGVGVGHGTCQTTAQWGKERMARKKGDSDDDEDDDDDEGG